MSKVTDAPKGLIRQSNEALILSAAERVFDLLHALSRFSVAFQQRAGGTGACKRRTGSSEQKAAAQHAPVCR